MAAYRIALEALDNVLRHAAASSCIIRLAFNDQALIFGCVHNTESSTVAVLSVGGATRPTPALTQQGNDLRLEY